MDKLTEWMEETVSMVLEQGYRAIPVFQFAPAPYGDNQNYLIDDPRWRAAKPSMVGVAMDRAVLIDYDGNKPDGAIPLAELQAILGVDLDKHLVQENKEGDSLHFLFKLPDHINSEDIKHSNDGWLHGIDVKTKNQLMHIKQRKTIIDSELPKLDQLSVIPEAALNALLIEHPVCDLSDFTAWDGSKPEVTEARKLLSFINPDCSYKDWSAVFAGIIHKFGQTSESYDLLDEWSSKGGKYTCTADIVRKAKSYTNTAGNVITFNSVCKLAESYGANLAKIGSEKESEKTLEKFPDLESCFECLASDTAGEDDREEAFNAACIHLTKIDNKLTKTKAMKKLKALSGVTMGDIKEAGKETTKEDNDPLTHLEMAMGWTAQFKSKGIIAEYGKLWFYCDKKGIWEEQELNRSALHIATKYNSEDRCARASDYNAIANVAYDGWYEKDFFYNAPNGVNTPIGFICVEDNELVTLRPNKDHRCTFRLSTSPNPETKTPLFDSVLIDAFGDTHDEQREFLLQLMGLSLLGVLPSLQLAVFLYGAGGSGKSTILKVLEALVPSDSRCSVKPEDFDKDYHRAALAGKRFNLVPEIDKDKLLPSADFKAIISGDTLSAREVYGKVFSMKPTAANWFNGNFFLATRDRSDAFWRRWAIVHFIHAKPEKQRVPYLDKKIIDSELAGVTSLALDAASRYLKTGHLVDSTESKRMIAQWKNNANSVLLWLNDEDCTVTMPFDYHGKSEERLVLRPKGSSKAITPLKVKDAYIHYQTYCKDTGRKPFSKPEFTQYAIEAGHPVTLIDGINSFNSLTFYSRLEMWQQKETASIVNMFPNLQ